MAGGETKDTVPAVLGAAARHPGVDAVVFLGMGIQGNVADMERSGPFFPGHGLERIVEFHERQEERYATAADELVTELGKPVLTATELALAQPGNPAVRTVRARGRYAYPSSNRAVAALAQLWWYERWRRGRSG
jgi:acetyltransferase